MHQGQTRLRAALLIAGASCVAGCNSNAAGFNLMDRAITVGDIVKIGAAGIAVAIVGAVVIYFLAALGKGMSR